MLMYGNGNVKKCTTSSRGSSIHSVDKAVTFSLAIRSSLTFTFIQFDYTSLTLMIVYINKTLFMFEATSKHKQIMTKRYLIVYSIHSIQTTADTRLTQAHYDVRHGIEL